MQINNIIEFCSKNEIIVKQNILLSELTSFKVGGIADILVYPSNVKQLVIILNYLMDNQITLFVMGKGSNLLCSDDGYRGVIIKTDCLSNIEANDNKITAMVGDTLASIARCTLNNCLSGFEFAALIPGSLGGAIYMNAGAYGGEMKDIVKKVTYLDENQNLCEIENNKCEFGYRTSIFKKNKYIIVSVEIELVKGDYNQIKDKMALLAFKRKSKQPLDYGSAGSTFKRPIDGYAAELIERCGLKGYTIGGACVSEKHSGFIINKNNATSLDISNLIAYVKDTVYKKTGIILELEVITL
ncbi:MAG: UDP-N-acetylmuramate dehydrogenase [Clostridia bacterium]